MRTQKGFTIIELVVVILLLGILTATALPRFMDVTDEAHQAAVRGTFGGFQSGLALYHAQWMAERKPASALTGGEFGTLAHLAAGYPVGAATPLADNADCIEIFSGLLQSGAPTIASVSVAGAADFKAGFFAGPTCEYVYTGEFTDGSDGGAYDYFEYNPTTGAVTLYIDESGTTPNATITP